MPDGRAHGYGKFKAANGNVYEGDWYQEPLGNWVTTVMKWWESGQKISKNARTAHKDKEPTSETRSPGNWSSGRLRIVSKIHQVSMLLGSKRGRQRVRHHIFMASRNSAHTQRQKNSRKEY